MIEVILRSPDLLDDDGPGTISAEPQSNARIEAQRIHRLN
jgi:hypothetical protein